MNKELVPIFIGGCPRSGTTMLGELISRHPLVKFLPEQNFKLPLFKLAHQQLVEGLSVEKMISVVKNHPKVRINNFDFSFDKHELEGLDSGAVARRITDQIATNHLTESDTSCEYRVDHTPSNLKIAGQLAAVYPKARFIHIIRDGRALFSSVKKLTWGPNIGTDAALWWSSELAFCLEAECNPDLQVYRIFYEKLLESPKEELTRLFNFLGLDFSENYALGGSSDFEMGDYSHDQHTLVGKDLDRKRIDSWKDELSQREIQLFERVAYPLLTSLGYRGTFPATKKMGLFELMTLRSKGVYMTVVNRFRQKKRIKRF